MGGRPVCLEGRRERGQGREVRGEIVQVRAWCIMVRTLACSLSRKGARGGPCAKEGCDVNGL